jgi:RNA-directed DNA polymerase
MNFNMPDDNYEPRRMVHDLGEKLNTLAYNYPHRRFSNLYTLMLNCDVIKYAYILVKSKKGCPGIDGISFKDIERDGLDRFINSIFDDLRKRSYSPSPNRVAMIPKGSGMLRKLSIPTIRDRIVQRAVTFLLNPIFEPVFHDYSYGYRPKISPVDAVYRVIDCIIGGLTTVFDADLEKCFDSLNGELVLNTLYKRVADEDLIALIKRFLATPTINNGVIENASGIPQGGVTSPLFSNLALHHLDDYFFHNRPPESLMVRYADDFLIMTKNENRALYQMIADHLNEMGLKLNPTKTSVINLRMGEPLNYLGYSIRVKRVMPLELAIKPRQKNIDRMKATIEELDPNSHNSIDQRLTSFEAYYSASNCPEIFEDLRKYAYKVREASNSENERK